MRSNVVNLVILIATVVFTTGAIFMLLTQSERKLQARRLSVYKHPVIVLKVDDSGCRTEIEMRTRVAAALR
jgi:hypothetical protein